MTRYWKVIGASVKGTSHIRNNTDCQDAHAYSVLPGEIILIAAADGAGSASRSQEGSRLVVDTGIATMQQLIAQKTVVTPEEAAWALTGAFEEACQMLKTKAKLEGISTRLLATTLTMVCATESWLVSGQIGDGIVVAEKKMNDFFSATIPQHGEYANETNFLVGSDSLNHLQTTIWKENISSIAVMTDGVMHLSVDKRTNQPVSGFFKKVLKQTRLMTDNIANNWLMRLLGSETVNQRTDDDKTLVVAVLDLNLDQDPSDLISFL